MNFVSYEFIAFAFIVIGLYFLCPLRWRCWVLLPASLVFYVQAGWPQVIFLLTAAVAVWFCALRMEATSVKEKDDSSGNDKGKTHRSVQNAAGLITPRSVRNTDGMTAPREETKDERKLRRVFWLMTGLLFLLVMLLYAKTGSQLAQALESLLQGEPISARMIVPLGISYYTFAAVGYLADVYWKKEQAEKNPLRILLYLCYFPQILQGPIPKYKRLAPQLSQGHRFDYQRVCFGLQRAVWGYFQKMVIADRLSLMVRQVFDNYLEYEGFVFVFGLVGAVFQLYCDFSGCMNIALGLSEVFGITLDENFRRPFYSVSAAEFWRRWHITLGTWFKDYVYMPLSVSPWLTRLGKRIKQRFGRTAARNVMTCIPLLIVWILTGLWHGTGWDYLVWGLYWGGIICFSTCMAGIYKKVSKRLGLSDDLGWWRVVRQWRTFLIYMGGRLLTIPGNLLTSRWIGRKMLDYNPWVLFDGTFFRLGWDEKDAWAAIIALLILWRVSYLQEKGVKIREAVAKWPLPIRWAFYIGAILAVLVFGVYGKGVSTSAFVYMNY